MFSSSNEGEPGNETELNPVFKKINRLRSGSLRAESHPAKLIVCGTSDTEWG